MSSEYGTLHIHLHYAGQAVCSAPETIEPGRPFGFGGVSGAIKWTTREGS